MDTAREYHRLALDCLELAEASRDPIVREQMVRLAELVARMHDRHSTRNQERRAA